LCSRIQTPQELARQFCPRVHDGYLPFHPCAGGMGSELLVFCNVFNKGRQAVSGCGSKGLDGGAGRTCM
jgi:hypothetical protein